MHVDKTDFNGNVNLGLLAYATNEYCLVGKTIADEDFKKLEEVLKVPVHKISIAGTDLIGVFLAGNSNCLLVPNITFDNELKALEKLGITYEVIDSEFTALGNNVLCNDEGAILNPDMDVSAKNQIQKALGVPIKSMKIADLEIVGSVCAHNTKKGLIHRDAEDAEIDIVEKFLKISLDIGTLNFGSPYIKSATIVNDNGFLVGESTTGPEIQNADYAFGFIQ